MSDQPSNPFDEAMRRIAAEAARVAKQVADADPEELARASGIDVERVRQWTDEARRRFTGEPAAPDRDQAPVEDPRDPREDAAPSGDLFAVPARPPATTAGPVDPRVPATDEQGKALAALDSGRWRVDAAEQRIVVARPDGSSDGPSRPRRTLRELAERDWVDDDGLPSVAGGVALVRWLERPVD